MVASVLIGSRQVGLDDVWSALQGQVEGFDQAAVQKRIPRTYLAVLAGAAPASARGGPDPQYLVGATAVGGGHQ